MSENLKLWKSVEKTNPKYTKPAKVGGMNITAISPQYQILSATEVFGSYGSAWGFKNIELDYSLTSTPIVLKVIDYKSKKEELINTILGLVGFKATFFYPNGEFEITNSIKIFIDNKHSKIDDNYAKKLETDALTKALSKLGFNADVFMGKFDDTRYVQEVSAEYQQKEAKQKEAERQAKLPPLTPESIQWKDVLKWLSTQENKEEAINNRLKPNYFISKTNLELLKK